MFIVYYYYYYYSKINYFIPDKTMYHFIFKRHVKPTFISSRRQWSIEENSRPEQSIPLQSATINWQGPKYSIFNMKVSRLKSYTHWPHGHYLCITSRITIFESTQYNLFIGQGGRTICFHCGGVLKIGVSQMTRGGNTHSGFRIASTFVISREKYSYANVGVVYTGVITLH